MLYLAKHVYCAKAVVNLFCACHQESLHYDKVLVATGGTPRKLFVPGADLNNIFTLRSWGSGPIGLIGQQNEC